MDDHNQALHCYPVVAAVEVDGKSSPRDGRLARLSGVGAVNSETVITAEIKTLRLTPALT
jgi:hypothetical protein